MAGEIERGESGRLQDEEGEGVKEEWNGEGVARRRWSGRGA